MTEETPEATRYRFGDFVLDVPDRQLWRDGRRIDLTARYLDALVLMVRESGQLVAKDRLFSEVWGDVIVSDSALTQCIKEIRKQLGDDAASPRYIQTVPRHGYRFVADVEALPREEVIRSPSHAAHRAAAPQPDPVSSGSDALTLGPVWRRGLMEWGVGTLGGGAAGLIGGMLYGYGIASAGGDVGTLSTLLVLAALSVIAGLAGGFGVSLGLAGGGVAAHYFPLMRILLRVAGAAFGGLVVGASAKLLGVDAFNLLVGRAPAGITGGPEGAALGAALALGAWLGNRLGERGGRPKRGHVIAGAGIGGAVAGAALPLVGGRLMGGSLDLLAQSFAESNLQVDALGALFGEVQFGLATQIILGGIEGLLFGSCVAGALSLARRMAEGGEGRWTL